MSLCLTGAIFAVTLTRSAVAQEGRQAPPSESPIAAAPFESRPAPMLGVPSPANAPAASSPLFLPPADDTPREVRLPLAQTAPGQGTINVEVHGDRLSLTVRNAPVDTVLSVIAQQHGLNIVTGEDTTGPVSMTLKEVLLEDALDAILNVNGYTWVRDRDIILVSRIASTQKLSARAQGRVIKVFTLNYVAASDVDLVIKGLLSPVGKSFISETSPTDKRRTREQLVVEDLPESLARIECYVAQIDLPPRQVLIEAHVLQVDLNDQLTHGVNFQALAKLAGTNVTLKTLGIANPAASPAFLLNLDSDDLDGLLEALRTTTDAKTLASPKVLALNGQEAKIQIGAQLGFFVTTTTETSTLQSVDFLDVGVVLRVTPIITDDHQVLMSVKPEVSSGNVDAVTGLPSEQTTEVETNVLLPDGQAMIIGGLIEETDSDIQSKVPWLGDLWGVGRLFQRRSVRKERSEIIIALVPRIMPYLPDYQAREDSDVIRATSRLLDGPLDEVDRTHFEPTLRNSDDRPKWPWDRTHPHYHPGSQPVHLWTPPAPSHPLLFPSPEPLLFPSPEPLLFPSPDPLPIAPAPPSEAAPGPPTIVPIGWQIMEAVPSGPSRSGNAPRPSRPLTPSLSTDSAWRPTRSPDGPRIR